MTNEFSENLSLNDVKARYDAQCKRVLSQKELHMSDQLGKEMHLMCNLSDLVEEHGIQQGIHTGHGCSKQTCQQQPHQSCRQTADETDHHIIGIFKGSSAKLYKQQRSQKNKQEIEDIHHDTAHHKRTL